MISIIFAYSISNDKENMAFGLNGGLPWIHHSEDLKQFKRDTQDNILIMGVETFKSLPKLLPNRYHVVISNKSGSEFTCKNGSKPHDVIYYDDKSDIPELIKNYRFAKLRDMSIIGGASLIRSCISIADRVIISKIDGEYNHDVTLNKREIVSELEKHELKAFSLTGFYTKVPFTKVVFTKTGEYNHVL